MTADNSRSIAVAGAAVLRLLGQLEERLARRPRAAPDPGLAAALTHIREEAGGLVELYAYATRPGRCAHCGQTGVQLAAALSSDPGQEVCAACELDPDIVTFPLAVLDDDREVWVVTRGDAAWLAGRAVTDDEAGRLAAVIGDATADTVACAVALVCGT